MHLMGNCYYNYSGLLPVCSRMKQRQLNCGLGQQSLVAARHIMTWDLGMHYYHGGNWKKAKFHLEAAAMAGHEGARNNIGHLEFLQFNNTDRAIKHWIIAASAGSYLAMNAMRSCFENGIDIDRESLNSTLTAYNTSCGQMRSEARDAFICSFLGIDLGDFN